MHIQIIIMIFQIVVWNAANAQRPILGRGGANTASSGVLGSKTLKVGEDEHKVPPGRTSAFGSRTTSTGTASRTGASSASSSTFGSRTTSTRGGASTGSSGVLGSKTGTTGTSSSTFGRSSPTNSATASRTGSSFPTRTSSFGSRTPSTASSGSTSTRGGSQTASSGVLGGRTTGSSFGSRATGSTSNTLGTRTPTRGASTGSSTPTRTSSFGSRTTGTSSTGGTRTGTSGVLGGGRSTGATSTGGSRFGTNSGTNLPTNQVVGGRAGATGSTSSTSTDGGAGDAEEPEPALPKCFYCTGVGQLDGKSLYTQGWKPKDTTPVENDCWTKPKMSKECQKGCVKTIAIGEPVDSTLIRELKKTGSGETRIRMIVRTCAEDMEKMITKLTEGPTKVPYSNCTYSKGAAGVLGGNSGLSICSCEGELCNGEKGVVYSLSSGSCRNGIRRYASHDLTPTPFNRKKPSLADQCDKFCAKNTICENTDFDPKQNRGDYCFLSKNPADCSVIVANGTEPLRATTAAPGVAASWLFCEVCDS